MDSSLEKVKFQAAIFQPLQNKNSISSTPLYSHFMTRFLFPKSLIFFVGHLLFLTSCTEDDLTDTITEPIIEPIKEAEYVTIPDSNFEQKLIDLGIDSDGEVNQQLLIEDAQQVDTLNLTFDSELGSDKKITDLTGIEAFGNLIELLVYNHALTTLSLTENVSLQRLNASGNEIDSIHLAANTDLIYLNLSSNMLEELELSANVNLDTAILFNNLLQTIDLSKNVNLININLYFNELTSVTGLEGATKIKVLNLSWNYFETLTVNLPDLEIMNVEQNFLTALDIDGSVSLQHLIARVNSIQSLNVENNIALKTLILSANLIETLSLDTNTDLELLWISSNLLTELDVSELAKLYDLSVGKNENLDCIKISEGQSIATFRNEERQKLSADGC